MMLSGLLMQIRVMHDSVSLGTVTVCNDSDNFASHGEGP
jgi:hypothetical protein